MIPAAVTSVSDAPTPAGPAEARPCGADFLLALQALVDESGLRNSPPGELGSAQTAGGADGVESIPDVEVDTVDGTERSALSSPEMLCALLARSGTELHQRAAGETADHGVEHDAQIDTTRATRAAAAPRMAAHAAARPEEAIVPGPDRDRDESVVVAPREQNVVSAEASSSRSVLTADFAQHALRMPSEVAPRVSPPPIPSPLGTPQWSQDFAARVSWLVDRGDQHASISVSPEELGPIEIRLAVREGEASIWFGAAHSETRVAIEQALPRLRDMLAGMGLSLADAGVFEHAPPDPRRGFVRADARRAAGDGAQPGAVETLLRTARRGLIDDYA